METEINSLSKIKNANQNNVNTRYSTSSSLTLQIANITEKYPNGQQQPILQEQQLQLHQKQDSEKTLYIVNLRKGVTEEDLYSLLSSSTTKYLRQKSYLEIIKCEKTEKSKGFAFVTTPTQIHKHTLELNGFSFKEKNLIFEEAKSKQKAIESPQNKNDQLPQPVDFSIQKKLPQKNS